MRTASSRSTPIRASDASRQIRQTYRILRSRNGHLNWWPGRTRIEIIVGAILTQNTAWTNVEKAIASLRARGLLSVAGLRSAGTRELQQAIRPSGYFRQKARKLKAFLALLDQTYGGRLANMRRVPTDRLRIQLLATWGIGPETADSILLYAMDRPVFVVDAYTRRVASRHGWIGEPSSYQDLQELFVGNLPRDLDLYNDYHAQIVWLGKHYCRTRARCEDCPLKVLRPRR